MMVAYPVETWYDHCKRRHRVGGPAIIYSDGAKRWYLFGYEYSIGDYIDELQRLGFLKEVEELLWNLAD